MKKIMYVSLDERPCNYNYANLMLSECDELQLIQPPISI